MKKWKYRKGCEKDFEGAPEWATHCVWNDKGGESFCYWLNEDEKRIKFNGLIMDWDGEYGYRNYIKAQREPVTECTFQDGVVFDAPIGMPLNEFKCRQQSLNANDSDIRISGIPVSEFSAKADVEVVKYDPTKVDIESLVAERGSRYGKFKDGAEIMQELKTVMREVDGWHNLTPSQREALDMIQHKIGRILNGDPTYDDSWKDIAGYATLIVNELNGEIK